MGGELGVPPFFLGLRIGPSLLCSCHLHSLVEAMGTSRPGYGYLPPRSSLMCAFAPSCLGEWLRPSMCVCKAARKG